MIKDLSPLLFVFIKQISISILKFLSEICLQFLRFFKALATEAISKISELLSRSPLWFLLLIIISGVAIVVTILLHDGARNKVRNFVQSTKEKIKPIIDKIIHLMKILFGKLIEYAEKSAPYANMIMISIKEFSKNIRKLKEEINTLLSDEILFNS